MNKIIIGLVAALVSGSALATKPDFPNGHDGRQEKTGKPSKLKKTVVANNDARITNDTRANAAAWQAQQQSASAQQSLTATTGGNKQTTNTMTGDQTVNINGAAPPAVSGTYQQVSGKVTIANTPDVAIAAAHPTAPCMGSASIGASVPGFGIGGGVTYKDDDCGKRETSRLLHSYGMVADAIAVLCSSEYAGAAPSCAALKPKGGEQ